MRNSFVKTLFEEASADENIVLITGDLGFQLFDDFAINLPKQFINAGLTEQTMMSMAAGIASTGKRVFVYSIANFSTFRCLEQIRNDVCYMDNPVVVVSVGAGFSYGTLGYSHHAIEDLAVMRSLPNMDVISPCDKFETEILTRVIARTTKPTYLRLGKSGEPLIHNTPPEISRGKFINVSKGTKGYIFFTGSVGILAMEAKKILDSHKIDVEILSVPFVSNLDEEYLKSINTHLPIVVLEEHSSRAGLGSAFLETLNKLGKYSKISHIAASQNEISLTGSQEFLKLQNGISVDKIINEFIH